MAVSIANDDRARDQRTNKLPQYVLVSLATLAAFSIGTNLAWTSPALPLYNKNDTLTISKQESSWICSVTPLGGVLGSLPAEIIVDKIGRKRSILITSLPLLLCWFVIGLAQSEPWIILARIVAGLATGMSSVVVPIYLSETLEDNLKKSLVRIFQIQIGLGILFTYLAGLSNNFHVIALLCTLSPAILSIASLLIPESPVWLNLQSRRREAENEMKRVRGRHYLKEEDIRELEEACENWQQRDYVSNLKENRRATVIVLGLMMFQQLSGINVLIAYSDSIFERVDFPIPWTVSSVIMGLIQVISAYFSNKLISRVGRKLSLFLGLATMSISMFIISGYFRFQNTHDVTVFSCLPFLSIIIFIIAFNIGAGPIPWILIDYIFPKNMQGLLVFISTVCSWIFAFLRVKLFQDMVDFMGASSTFATFGMVTLIGTAFVAILVPETEEKTFEEIQDELY